MAEPNQSLYLASLFPYDGDDAGKIRRGTRGKHYRAARGILADLKDRRDIKRGFENIDHDVRCEIVDSLAAIIEFAYREKK